MKQPAAGGSPGVAGQSTWPESISDITLLSMAMVVGDEPSADAALQLCDVDAITFPVVETLFRRQGWIH